MGTESRMNINVSKGGETEQDEVFRPLGFTVSAIFAVASAAMAKSIIDNTAKYGKVGFSWLTMISDIGCILMLSHFIMSCALPEYLLGKPPKWKISTLVVGGVLTFLAGILSFFFCPEGVNPNKENIFFWLEFLSPIPFIAYGYFVHLLDDEEDKSFLLMFKPWRRAGDNCGCKV